MCFYLKKLLSYTLILLHSLIAYIFSCCSHFQYLGSISSYIFSLVSTPFEPTTCSLCVIFVSGHFSYKRQSAQPLLVFQHKWSTTSEGQSDRSNVFIFFIVTHFHFSAYFAAGHSCLSHFTTETKFGSLFVRMSSSRSLSFEKLEEDNYSVWKVYMEVLLV